MRYTHSFLAGAKIHINSYQNSQILAFIEVTLSLCEISSFEILLDLTAFIGIGKTGWKY